MQQRFVIGHLLFVPHTQLAVIVHPRMGSFHDPTSSASLRFVASLGHSLLGYVRNIPPLPYLLLGGLTGVPLVRTEILGSPLRGLRSWDYDRVQRLSQQLHVMPIGGGDDKRERGATAVHQQTALGSLFSPDLSGYFPPLLAPRAPCLGSRPRFAIPTQFPPSRRTRPTPRATSAQKNRVAATAESDGESRWRCRSSWARPSTGTRCAAHTRWRRKCREEEWICVRRPPVADTCVFALSADCVRARAVQLAPKAHRRLPKIELLACSDHEDMVQKDQIFIYG